MTTAAAQETQLPIVRAPRNRLWSPDQVRDYWLRVGRDSMTKALARADSNGEPGWRNPMNFETSYSALEEAVKLASAGLMAALALDSARCGFVEAAAACWRTHAQHEMSEALAALERVRVSVEIEAVAWCGSGPLTDPVLDAVAEGLAAARRTEGIPAVRSTEGTAEASAAYFPRHARPQGST